MVLEKNCPICERESVPMSFYHVLPIIADEKLDTLAQFAGVRDHQFCGVRICHLHTKNCGLPDGANL